LETFHLTHCQESISLKAEACVMAMGFFDGVHLGHRRVIARAKQIAMANHLQLAVMTFFPHPKEVLSRGEIKMDYLTPIGVKEEIFAELGVDKLYIVKFDEIFALVSPKEFIHKYVVGLNVVHVVAGFDFTYGCKGLGDMNTIEAHGGYTFRVTTVPKMELSGSKISSTLIRELLASGNVREIASYLGNDYETRGKFLLYTRSLTPGYLKAEIASLPNYTLPKAGFYEIEVYIDHRHYQGIACVRSKLNTIMVEIELFHCHRIQNCTIKIKWLNRLTETKKIQAADRLVNV